MAYSENKSTSTQKKKTVASQVDQTVGAHNSADAKTEPMAEKYKHIVEALSGFGGRWKLPPLNLRVDTSTD